MLFAVRHRFAKQQQHSNTHISMDIFHQIELSVQWIKENIWILSLSMVWLPVRYVPTLFRIQLLDVKCNYAVINNNSLKSLNIANVRWILLNSKLENGKALAIRCYLLMENSPSYHSFARSSTFYLEMESVMPYKFFIRIDIFGIIAKNVISFEMVSFEYVYA